jgi:glyoxylase-like metal-dependent hydrolase (beta-lactamase superfamily II)
MKIIPLSEGAFTIDHTKVFVPFDDTKDDLQQRPLGSLLVEIQPFLVVTGSDLLLLDTGLGFSRGGVLQLFENLALHGYSPQDITKVLMSHLHRDHAGGMAVQHPYRETRETAFPHATYFIHRDELAYALGPGKKSYDTDLLAFFQGHEQVQLLGDHGEIEGGIVHERSGGHAPYHQVFTIREGRETVFFGGDEAPQLRQMKTKFVAKYDHDGKKAMELRQQWWSIGAEEGWTFLFYHDSKTPCYKQ